MLYYVYNIVLYVLDEHVVFEGQMSSQRSTRAKSAASFYYCTYLASLEWAILKTFLKIYGSKYTHQLVLFKGFFQMCLHAPYRKIRISAGNGGSRIGTAFAGGGGALGPLSGGAVLCVNIFRWLGAL